MIRWGIIGCGAVAEVKSGPAFSQASDSELVAVMRRNGVAARDFATRHGVGRWSSHADDILCADDIDAVYIATPPNTHAAYAIKAANLGKHVLVEKPMALSVAQCNAMISASAVNNRALSVAFYRRTLARFEKLRELIQTGVIGQPRTVYSRMHRASGGNDLNSWKLNAQINGGGLFVDMQVHVLDWLQYVFGKPTQVVGLASNQSAEYAAEDTVVASIGYPGGVLASIDCCFESDRDEQGVTITGSAGRVSMPFLRHGDIVVETHDEEQRFAIEDPTHVHLPFVERVNAHLHGYGGNPCDGEAGRDNIQTVRQILD